MGEIVVADQNGKFLFNPASEKIIGIGSLDIPKEKWADTYGVFWPDTKISMDPNDPIDESPTWRKCR
jgi:hypothetical protein